MSFKSEMIKLSDTKLRGASIETDEPMLEEYAKGGGGAHEQGEGVSELGPKGGSAVDRGADGHAAGVAENVDK